MARQARSSYWERFKNCWSAYRQLAAIWQILIALGVLPLVMAGITNLCMFLSGNPWLANVTLACVAISAVAWIVLGLLRFVDRRRAMSILKSDLLIDFDLARDRIASPVGHATAAIFSVCIKNHGERLLTGVAVEIESIEQKRASKPTRDIMSRIRGLRLETLNSAVPAGVEAISEVDLAPGAVCRQFAVVASEPGRDHIRVLHCYRSADRVYFKECDLPPGKYIIRLRAVSNDTGANVCSFEIHQTREFFRFKALKS